MEHTPSKKHTVHHVLTHSYLIFFFGLLLGLATDLFYPLRLLSPELSVRLGLTLIFLSPLLILWAQYTSHQLRAKKDPLCQDDFCRGPYRFSKNPTHLGLALMILGFGVLVNSTF